MNKNKIALLCIRGLPAQYGAYDQTSHELVSNEECKNYSFIVPCENSLSNTPYDYTNTQRIFLNKTSGGIGTIIYGLKSTFLAIKNGAKTLVFFGYGLAPIFPFLKLFGYRVICNVDGIEWERAKWGKIAKFYFKFCEFISAYTPILRVYDAKAIKDYYIRKYNAKGKLIYYGSDTKQFNQDYSKDSKSNDKFAIVVMRMEPENNILNIVKAFSKKTIGIKLKIIGPSTNFFEKICMPMIAKSKNIDYLGPIYDRKILIEKRSAASVYIHGHSVGGTNPTLVEACHIRKPIIAHDNKYNREVLKERGFFFKDSDDLYKIVSKNEWKNIIPPSLSSDYEWCTICQKYTSLFEL